MKLRNLCIAFCAAVVLAGCGGNPDAGIRLNPGGISNGPTNATPDVYLTSGVANFTASAAQGVLANDSIAGFLVTPLVNQPTAQGGVVNLAEDGSFSYVPPAGFVGVDTFNYDLNTQIGTVTLVTDPAFRVFFVRNNAAAGGNGTLATPFTSLAPALAAANQPNDIVYVQQGTQAPISDAISLDNGQQLLGETEDLKYNTTTILAGQTDRRPRIGGTVTLNSDGTTVAGFSFVEYTADAIVAVGRNGATIRNNLFTDGSANALSINNSNGTFAVLNNTMISKVMTGDFINMISTTGNLTLNVNGNNTTTPQDALSGEILSGVLSGNAALTLNVDGHTSTGQSEDFIEITNTGTGAINATVLNSNVLGNANDALCFVASGASVMNITARNVNFEGLSDAGNGYVIDYLGTSSGTTVIENSVFKTFGSDTFVSGTPNNVNFASRNNRSLTVLGSGGNAGSDSVEISQLGTGTLCLEYVGNSLRDLNLTQVSGTFNIEQFAANLATINTITTIVPMGTLTSVADGACMIP